MSAGSVNDPDRPSPCTPPTSIEVSAGLIFRNGQLLIARPHETFEACLRRELHEELGVEVRVGPLFDTVTHPYPDRVVLLKFYLCELPTGEPRPLDCAAVKWVTRADLSRHEFPAADAGLVQKLQATAALWQ
jgi:mutator protein MutT